MSERQEQSDAQSPKVLGRHPIWLAISQPLAVLATASNALGTLIVLFLVVCVNVDVVARNLFSAPMKGTVELVQFSLVMIVFLQLPDVVRINRLTRSDGALGYLAGRRPGAARVIARCIDVSAAFLMGCIFYTMWPEVLEAYRDGDYYGTPGIFTMPTWPTKLAIAFAGAVCCAIFLLKAITGSRRPELLHLERSGL